MIALERVGRRASRAALAFMICPDCRRSFGGVAAERVECPHCDVTVAPILPPSRNRGPRPVAAPRQGPTFAVVAALAGLGLVALFEVALALSVI